MKIALFWSFYLGPVLTLPLMFALLAQPLGFSWSDISADTRFLLKVAGAVIVANLLLIWYAPHYSAPITGVVLALFLIAMRCTRAWRWHGKPTGTFITRMVPSVCVLLLLLASTPGSLHWGTRSRSSGSNVPTWCWQSLPNLGRAAVFHKLRAYGGGQLVIVHYSPEHNPETNDWVHNRADLNSAKVIWADDMGPAKNQELINYFKGRQVWLVDADAHPPKLVPYSEAAGRAGEAVNKPPKQTP